VLEVFKNLDFSESISIKKELPAYKKIAEGFDYVNLLDEMNKFAISENKASSPWFQIYGKSIETPLEELANIGLTVGYQQWQMTQKQIATPWQTWRDGIGPITRDIFETHLDGFHRPRYVEVQPGWEVTNHRDWGDNNKLGLRCHLILETNDDCRHYVTDDEGVEHELHFAPGEVWFYNIEKLHRAKNAGSTIRKSISFELFTDDLL
jgi:hypothetical protein